MLGTLQAGRLQPFAQPFELCYANLPARIDRQALTRSAFGQAYPQMLCLASNSCPLIVQRGADRVVRVLAGIRKDAQGQDLPMYYRLDTLAPWVGEHALTQASTMWVVNDPQGVQSPAGGAQLPALVIELRCAL